MTSLSERLKSQREARGLSQAALARKACVSKSLITSLENDPTRGTTKLNEIAKALNVNPVWLGTGKGNVGPYINPESPWLTASSLDDLAQQIAARGPEFLGKLVTLVVKHSK